jgi:hypothetical protein
MQLFFPEKKVDQRVLDLEKIPQYEQKSQAWLDARQTCISASDISSSLMQSHNSCDYYLESFKDVDTFEFKIDEKKNCNKYSSQKELLLKKCNRGPPFTGNIYTLHGQKYEEIVSNVYSQMNQIDVHEFGLLKHPIHSFLGASPDGITSDGVMIEIKCPPIRKVQPFPSLQYFHQMLLQLECTGLSECDFFDAHFVEYTDVSSWEVEAENWWIENPNSLHHIYGIIKTIIVNNEEKHVYANPLIKTLSQFKEWINDTETFDKLTYYKLNEFYISRITHSKDWFKSNLPDFEKMWKSIEYHRTLEGIIELDKTVKKTKPRVTLPVFSKYNTSLFT